MKVMLPHGVRQELGENYIKMVKLEKRMIDMKIAFYTLRL